MPIHPVPSCAELEQLYLNEQLGVAAIAQRFHCSPATVSNWLRRCKIATRSGRFRQLDISRALLEHLYVEEQLSLRQIAARLGVSVGTIANRRRIYGLPQRSRPARRAGEAQREGG